MNAWQCDRCSSVSSEGNIDVPPDDWRFVTLPVRGSEGARWTREGVICDACDDSLHKWLIDLSVTAPTISR